jgi:prophage regulatory protein
MEKFMSNQGAQPFEPIPRFCQLSSLCRATVYNLIEAGELPRPIRLTRNRVAFPPGTYAAWAASKMEAA